MPESRPGNTTPQCELGVTGKRVRRALPAVSPPLAFRAALKAAICGQPEDSARAQTAPLTTYLE